MTGEVRSGEPRNVRVVLEYDGSGFEGFQRQKSARTIQGEMEACLKRITGQAVRVVGAGRTDAGVHASGQVANFSLGFGIPTDRLASAMNRSLPPDIVVRSAEDVAADFHARYSARSRVYEYTILNTPAPDALRWRFVWHLAEELDLDGMRSAAGAFAGRHDFSAFGTPEPGRSPTRDVSGVELVSDGSTVRCRIEANAFLRHMARGMVGALYEVGTGRRGCDAISRALQEGGVRPSFVVAPPGGLCLVSVRY